MIEKEKTSIDYDTLVKNQFERLSRASNQLTRASVEKENYEILKIEVEVYKKIIEKLLDRIEDKYD